MIVKIGNQYIQVSPAPTLKLPYLLDWLRQLEAAITKYGLGRSETNNAIANLEYYAHLNQVEGFRVDLTQAKIEEIQELANAISEVNFPQRESDPAIAEKEEKAPPITLQDYAAKNTALLVNLELCPNLESALKIANNTPFDLVDGIISERIKFLNRDKIQQEESATDLVNELNDGSFWGKPDEKGQDGFQKGMLAAMGMK